MVFVLLLSCKIESMPLLRGKIRGWCVFDASVALQSFIEGYLDQKAQGLFGVPLWCHNEALNLN